MDSILPLATSSATETVYVTTTGIEKWLTLIGLATILLLALFGLLTILWLIFKNSFKRNKGLSKNLLK